MSKALQVLLVIYSLTLVINLLLATILYKLKRHELFRILINLWVVSLINFLLQAMFTDSDLLMYLSFSTYIFVSLCLKDFTNLIIKRKESNYYTEICSFAFIVAGGIVLFHFASYKYASLLSAIAITIPMLMSSFRLLKLKCSIAAKAYAILLILNSIHFLDYPFLRSSPLGAVWGFSVAMLLLFAFSSFFPGFILLQMSQEYADKLKSDVKIRTQELEDALGQNKVLVSILCHDLSNPLTVLLYYFGEIKRDNISTVHSKLEKRAIRSLNTILSIVNKVKELQSITYGKKILIFKKINLTDVVNEVLVDFENTLAAKNIKFTFNNLTNSDAIILGDVDLLKNQILNNLIGNAIKFSYSHSFIEIIISEEEGSIFMAIKDHGIGIPNDLVSKLFIWSEKTNRVGTEGESGTGLGLPLVKTCVEMMGGRIRVESISKDESNSDSGTKFIVQFDKSA